MWRKSKTKSAGKLAALGLLQDAMGRVEQERAAAEGQEILQRQVPSQQGPPRDRQGPPGDRQDALHDHQKQGPSREASTTGTGGAGR